MRKSIGNYLDICDNTWLTYVKDFIATIEALSGGNMFNPEFQKMYQKHYNDIKKLEADKAEYLAALRETVSKVQSMSTMFWYTSVANFEALSKWDTRSLTNMRWAFSDMSSLTSLDGLEDWDVSNVDNMERLFGSDTNLQDISALMDWDVSSLVNAKDMFQGGWSIQSLDGLQNWELDNVESMASMFHGCQTIATLEYLADWHVKPTTLYQCFADCSNLTSLEGVENFDTSRCTNMQSTFYNIWKVKDVNPLKDWDVSKVTNFQDTFNGLPWLEDISALADWDETIFLVHVVCRWVLVCL